MHLQKSFGGKCNNLLYSNHYVKHNITIPTSTVHNIFKGLNLFFSEIGSVFHELDSDPDCRAIVLSGNGKMFCAGNPTIQF